MSIHRALRISLSSFVFGLLILAGCLPSASAAGANKVTSFRPVDPEELKMTFEPAAPGAPAIILYREVNHDDSASPAREDAYYRIKILTEEGRKYADIEIPYLKESVTIKDIHARTIKPDGSIVDFEGKVTTKSVVKARGLEFNARTFTLPAVQVGCILEYYYTEALNSDYYYYTASNWILSDELFTKAGGFTLNPNRNMYLRWTWENMPAGEPQPKQGTDHIIRLQVTNIPAFPTEDYMPPLEQLKARVDFIYTDSAPETNVDHFWTEKAKKGNAWLDGFLGKPKALQPAVAEIVGPNDPPEVKLQKLYARVQQLRNTSYEVSKTEEEEKRAKEKEPGNAEDVWKRGYGTGVDLTWLYLALVRAAGFEAYGVLVAERDKYYFEPNLMQSGRLNQNIVLIKLNGKNIFCDPGAAFTPFGLLPWSETAIQGLQLDKKQLIWVTSLVPTSDQARTERHAQLTLSDTGDLEGKLTVTYTGLEAARLRVEERHADETERQKFLEDTVKGYIPASTDVKLTNKPEWKNSALPLAAEFEIKIPGWASAAGHHYLVPVGLFSAPEKHLFDHEMRIYPIYVNYPFLDSDDIEIQLPAGWQASSVPKGWTDSGKVVAYSFTAQNDNGKLHLARTLNVNFITLEQQYYSALRHYFQLIKATDDQQIVLDAGPARAGN
jgi:transglutaminase-like putative cysteine protease